MESSVSVQSNCLLNRLFDQAVFTIKRDVKPSCRPNVLILLFNSHMKSKTKLIKETSIPLCRAGPLARVYMEKFSSRLGGTPAKSSKIPLLIRTYSFIRKSFFMEGEI